MGSHTCALGNSGRSRALPKFPKRGLSPADASKVKRELSWTAKRDLLDMCRDAWRFEKNYEE